MKYIFSSLLSKIQQTSEHSCHNFIAYVVTVTPTLAFVFSRPLSTDLWRIRPILHKIVYKTPAESEGTHVVACRMVVVTFGVSTERLTERNREDRKQQTQLKLETMFFEEQNLSYYVSAIGSLLEVIEDNFGTLHKLGYGLLAK